MLSNTPGQSLNASNLSSMALIDQRNPGPRNETALLAIKKLSLPLDRVFEEGQQNNQVQDKKSTRPNPETRQATNHS